ncbi:DNA polymerase IV [Enterovirga aerilata]|uniref:DNA polymerase IV n=1 Tax=Enterovirga aerilata TaxID=2730920 RepID=UPI003211CB10
MPTICRDCEAGEDTPEGERCARCGSPRLLRHPELDRLAIAHVDCDAFYAAVEKRDDPALRDVPVIVGGGTRGVVATACYIARTYGIRSAMPMFKALKACPHATVIRPNFDKYSAVGREVRRLMLELTPLVEPISIDEAFLDLTGTERVHGAGAARTLVRFARRVEREIGITVSVGLSYNKFLAKIASDQEKPRGFSVLGRSDALDVISPRPVGILPGIGRQTEARLQKAGLRLVRDLRDRRPEELIRLLGRDGERLARLARGEDARKVEPRREAKSVSAETTFNADIARFEELEPILWRLCEKVSLRLKRSSLAGRSVVLKLKDRNFRLATRTRSGLPATQLARRLFEPARAMLRDEADGTYFRLIGVGASDLCPAEEADRGDLADLHLAEEVKVEAAIDRIREKFGAAAVQKGLAFPFVSAGTASQAGAPAASSPPSGRNPRNRGGEPG